MLQGIYGADAGNITVISAISLAIQVVLWYDKLTIGKEGQAQMRPADVPDFNSPDQCKQWCLDVALDRLLVSTNAKAWAIAMLVAYRFGAWPKSAFAAPKALKRSLGQTKSKYGFVTSKSADASTVPLSGKGYSRKPVTLPKLPQPKGDYDD